MADRRGFDLRAGAYKAGGFHRQAGNICTVGPIWTQRVASASRNWQAIAFGNPLGTPKGIFVACGGSTNGAAMFSTNSGQTWNNATTPPTFAGGLPVTAQCLKYGNGVWVAVNGGGGANCSVTSDGDNWTNGISIPISASIQSLIFDGTVFIAFCSGDSHCFTSPDGVTWTQRNMPANDSWTVGGFDGSGLVICIAQSGNVAKSLNHGASWTAALGTTPSAISISGAVPFGNGTFVGIPNSAGSQLFYSNDSAASWHLSNVISGVLVGYCDAKFLQSLFVVVDTGGQHTAKGTDGINYSASGLLPAGPTGAWCFDGDGLGNYAAVVSVGSGTTVCASGVC